MKRSLQILSVFLAVLLAVRMMAQDTGGGAGGGGSDSNSGAPSGTDNSGATGSGMDQGTSNGGSSTGEGTTNGATGTGEGNTNGGETTLPQGGADQGQGGNGTGGLMGPGTENPQTGGEILAPAPEPGAATEGPATGGSVIVPIPGGTEGLPPGAITPTPGITPAPTPAGAASVAGRGQGAAAQAAPISFTLPGGYGGGASQTLTLGQGRLAKPPVTFSVTVSQGYDDNLFDATSHPVATPTPSPALGTPERTIVGYTIIPPFAVPIYAFFRGKAPATPTPVPTEGVVGSAVSTVTIAAQVQSGSPRTVFTMDAALGALNYWNRPGNKIDYNGNFDLSMVHRISPRATLSMEASAVYSKTPNFSLINAPTTNGGGAYLNGDFKTDLTYNWSSRISTVTSYDIAANLEGNNSGNNLYSYTVGNQLRYIASSRNTITAEIRDSETVYPSNAGANNGSIFYIVGLDSYLSARLRNTFGVGIQQVSYSSGGQSQTLPYFESATSLSLARGAGISWTNRVGAENSGAANETASSYRTTLSYSEPFSSKLVGSVSLDYNYYTVTDNASSSGSYSQNQLEGTATLGYNVSPRLSLNLSYTYTDLLTTQVNSAYTRQQVFLGGTYQFK